jgi:ribosome-binding protein aMBF1 (putative translation factor)
MICELCGRVMDLNAKKPEYFYVVRGISVCDECYERELVEPLRKKIEAKNVSRKS